MEEVYIVQAYRTAVGKSKKGKLRFTRADDLGAGLINQMVEKIPNFQKKVVLNMMNHDIHGTSNT